MEILDFWIYFCGWGLRLYRFKDGAGKWDVRGGVGKVFLLSVVVFFSFRFSIFNNIE